MSQDVPADQDPGPPAADPKVLEEAVDAVIAYVRKEDFVSFAELMNRFEHLFGGTWFQAVKMKHGGVAIYWHGFSDLGIQVFSTKKLNDAVAFVPMEYLCYMIDGHALGLPTITTGRRFKGERWCPTGLRPIEKVPPKKRFPRWDVPLKEQSRPE